MDTMSETYFHADPDDSTSPEGLLDALIRAFHEPASFAHEAPQEPELARDDLADMLRWRLPLEAPPSFEEQSAWLARIEGLDLAWRGASRLLASHPWLASLRALLASALESLEPAVRQLTAPWWHSRTAELQLAEAGLPDLRPWTWVSPPLPEVLEALAPEARDDVLRAWGDGALASSAEQWLSHRVREDAGWNTAYRTLLARRAEAWFELRDLSLEYQPTPVLFRLPLPHLGRRKELRGILTPEGTRWVWPGHAPQTAPRGARSVTLPLEEPVGNLVVNLREEELDPRQGAERVLQSSRVMQGGIPDEQHLELAVRIAGWCHQQLEPLKAAAEAAERVATNQEADFDAFWPGLLAEIRFHLESSYRILKRPDVLGDRAESLRNALRTLDQSARGLRAALELLEEGFLEDLESSVGPLPSGAWCSPLPPVPPSLWAALVASEPTLPAKPVTPIPRPRKLRAPMPQAAVALGAGGGPAQGERIDWFSEDGWEAFLSLPGQATEETRYKLFFLNLPPEARTCVLAGMRLEIQFPDGPNPFAEVQARALFEAEKNDPEELSVLRIEVDGRLSEARELSG